MPIIGAFSAICNEALRIAKRFINSFTGISLNVVGLGAVHRRLFLTHEYLHGGTGEIPVVADFILQETAVWLLDPLGEITEEHEGRDYGTLELGDVFDFDVFTFVRRRGVGSDCSSITLLS